METILEVKDLRKSYPTFSLNNVSFRLFENTITGFIGVNGSGKTTTIRTILGLTLKDAGNIKIFGKDFIEHEKEIKNRIGFVFDEGYFYEHLTISEMKSVIAPAYSTWSEMDFKSYLDRFHLDRKQKISTLSKGMRVKYALSLALSHQADLLILDEPSSGLDPLVRSEIHQLLLEYVSQKGKSVLFSTHITSDLETIADAILLIDKGNIILNRDKAQLLASHKSVQEGDPSQISSPTLEEIVLTCLRGGK
ncbi:ABC transporter ATP-binding protein [Paenibacillus sp. YN15]|uniref:ABC transporter ATP-binding protein n=1 Tax=Paenibacillus sp. YN15 TaxID=1742774 RepID=UPI000DCE8A50|nr:ABC transporter ATP-binding protein [Paenibacillus sp. YN15]RAU90921.1 sodium ABC transporter ATP-binding protein [Paenibacillus sp. YN15]